MGWKSVRKDTNGNKSLLLPRNTEAQRGLEKRLANLWSQNIIIITRKAHAGLGQEAKRENPR
jgi:hypothetical protein